MNKTKKTITVKYSNGLTTQVFTNGDKLSAGYFNPKTKRWNTKPLLRENEHHVGGCIQR